MSCRDDRKTGDMKEATAQNGQQEPKATGGDVPGTSDSYDGQ